jgi:hypothetical protein
MKHRTTHRPEPVQEREASPSEPAAPRKLELSLAQTIGGSLAAATAAAAGSQLGAAGTITGAAVVSVVASVAGALYTSSLRHTGDRVSSVLRAARGGPAAWSLPRLPARRVLAGAVTVFAITVVAVTGLELAAGRSLSGDGGTTVTTTLKASTGDSSTRTGRDEGPRESPAQTTTPSQSVSPTASETPSPTSTDESTPTPPETGSPSASATPYGSPSASPSAAPTTEPSVTPSDPAAPPPVVSESVTP